MFVQTGGSGSSSSSLSKRALLASKIYVRCTGERETKQCKKVQHGMLDLYLGDRSSLISLCALIVCLPAHSFYPGGRGKPHP